MDDPIDDNVRAAAILVGNAPLPPLRCGWCRSPSIEPDADFPDDLQCVTCGRKTTEREAHEMRRREIAEMLSAGEDDYVA